MFGIGWAELMIYLVPVVAVGVLVVAIRVLRARK